MPLTLHTIKASQAKKKRKRVGRGNASGRGTYSTRGLKGQKARSGSSGLKLKGFKQNLLNVPKLRGFKSIHTKPFSVNLDTLVNKFKEGEVVNLSSLRQKGLITKSDKAVKILSRGEVDKKLVIEGCLISQSAKEKIEKAGGKVK